MNIPLHWKEGVLGSSLTSIKIGGSIRYFSRPKTQTELQADIQTAQELQLPFRVIGGGSNIVIADQGFAGLIIQPALTGLRVLEAEEAQMYQDIVPVSIAARYRREGEEYLHLEDVAETEGEPTYLEMETGVSWGQAVIWSLRQNCVGLHWYARIPCQVGGALFNNIHGESHYVGEHVVVVTALDPKTGELKSYSPADLDFGYDYSRFHESGEIILSVVFRLNQVSKEAAEKAQAQYLHWTKVKNEIQPTEPNCGSVFQNIPEEVATAHGETAVAAAYYIDQRCGLRGEKLGQVQVAPGHGNFIINLGQATQADFIALVRLVQERVQEVCGVALIPEVECLTETGERYQW